jgi:Domain of unknown function (DUF5753)
MMHHDMEFQEVRENRRFPVVLEEQALRTRVGDTNTNTMAEQLDRLMTVQSRHGQRG